MPGNNPAPNNPMGNPLGLLGRFFAPPGQPAQAINPPPNVPARAVQNQGTHGQHNPVVIEYRIQYQTPTPGFASVEQNNNAQSPPATLQPIRPLDGFVGPNGAWQRWPGNRDNIENSNAIPLNASIPDAETREEPPTAVALLEEQIEGTGPTDSEDPRAAAAIAALRRSGGKPPSLIELPSNGEDHSARETHVENSSTSAAPSQAPRWIPLFDLSMTRSHTSASILAPETFHTQPSSTIGQNTSLSQSPQQITDAQLALLDNLTREAIDERLRILESVSGIVDQCVENLLKVRSALPVTEALNGSSQDTIIHAGNRSSSSTSEIGTGNENAHTNMRDKGKGIDHGSESQAV